MYFFAGNNQQIMKYIVLETIVLSRDKLEYLKFVVESKVVQKMCLTSRSKAPKWIDRLK